MEFLKLTDAVTQEPVLIELESIIGVKPWPNPCATNRCQGSIVECIYETSYDVAESTVDIYHILRNFEENTIIS